MRPVVRSIAMQLAPVLIFDTAPLHRRRPMSRCACKADVNDGEKRLSWHEVRV